MNGAVDWQPIIVAIAGLIVASTPGLVALVQGAANRGRLQVIADGQKADLAHVVEVLERLERGRVKNEGGIDAIHRRLDQLQAPPAAASQEEGHT